jgi:hypothetical protein
LLTVTRFAFGIVAVIAWLLALRVLSVAVLVCGAEPNSAQCHELRFEEMIATTLTLLSVPTWMVLKLIGWCLRFFFSTPTPPSPTAPPPSVASFPVPQSPEVR